MNALITETEDDHHERRSQNKKETTALYSLIVTVAIQTGGFIWWAATLTANMQNLSLQLVEMKSDRYTRSDASKDFDRVRDKDAEIERRLTVIEAKANK